MENDEQRARRAHPAGKKLNRGRMERPTWPVDAYVIEMVWRRPNRRETWSIKDGHDAELWFKQLAGSFDRMGFKRIALVRPDGSYQLVTK